MFLLAFCEAGLIGVQRVPVNACDGAAVRQQPPSGGLLLSGVAGLPRSLPATGGYAGRSAEFNILPSSSIDQVQDRL